MTAIRLKPIEEQVVVLIGVSSGIGRETALWLARKGAKVLVSARGEDGLNSLVEEIRGEGGEATMTIADTSEFDQVKAVADRAVEQYGRLDTWVHLAAVGLFATFELTTPREFERVVDVDLMGQVYAGYSRVPVWFSAPPRCRCRRAPIPLHRSTATTRVNPPAATPRCASVSPLTIGPGFAAGPWRDSA
jgi:NAD(P)-dependent dehydrogenase (short-subunit alcohol dehydrogenase family)